MCLSVLAVSYLGALVLVPLGGAFKLMLGFGVVLHDGHNADFRHQRERGPAPTAAWALLAVCDHMLIGLRKAV